MIQNILTKIIYIILLVHILYYIILLYNITRTIYLIFPIFFSNRRKLRVEYTTGMLSLDLCIKLALNFIKIPWPKFTDPESRSRAWNSWISSPHKYMNDSKSPANDLRVSRIFLFFFFFLSLLSERRSAVNAGRKKLASTQSLIDMRMQQSPLPLSISIRLELTLISRRRAGNAYFRSVHRLAWILCTRSISAPGHLST